MTEWLWILFVQWGAAATILPLGAMGAAWLLRRKSAAVRHRIWTLALGGVLLFPLLGAYLPQAGFFNRTTPDSPETSLYYRHFVFPRFLHGCLREPGAPEPHRTEKSSGTSIKTPGTSNLENAYLHSIPISFNLTETDDVLCGFGANSTPAGTLQTESGAVPVETAVWSNVSPIRIVVARSVPYLLAVWLFGVAILFHALWESVRHAGRICREASVFDGEWSRLANEIRVRLRIRRPVRLLVSNRVSVPMVIGFLRQGILFPCRCDEWSDAEKRSILLHEYSHCQRRDPLWLLLARVTTALCWFHPLVWYVSRRMKVEREFACDDAVLLSGECSDVYASTLFDIAVQAAETGGCTVLGVAMARRQSRISERISSVLDAGRDRRPTTRLGMMYSILFVVAALATVAQTVPPLPAFAAGTTNDSKTIDNKTINSKTIDNKTIDNKTIGNKTARRESDEHSTAVKSEKTLTLHLVDREGKPVANADGFHYFGKKTTFTSDDAGRVVIDLDKDPSWRFRNVVTVEIHKPNYAPAGGMFRPASPIPADFTMTLDPADRIGGRLVDEKGESLSGIEVNVGTGFGTTYDIGEGYSTVERTKTNADGWWTVATLPKGKTGRVGIVFKRTGYPDYQVWGDVNELKTEREGRFVRRDRYPDGIAVAGKVIGPNGEPVPGAKVWGNHLGFQEGDFCKKTAADESGRFRFDHWVASETGYVIANAKGFGPALVEHIKIKPGMEPVVLRLTKARELKFRVVDPNGDPVPNFNVAFDTWRNYRMMEGFLLNDDNSRFGKTDAGGRYVWKSAPAEKVQLDFFDSRNPPRFSTKGAGWFTARDEEYVVKLNPVLTVSGRVTDQETGKTIPHVTATLGEYLRDGLIWDFFSVPKQDSNDGTFRLTRSDLLDDRSAAVRIVADGYYPGVSRKIGNDEGTVTVDVALKKMTVDKRIRGCIVSEEGKPLSGVTIEIATRDNRPYIQNGELYGPKTAYRTRSDEHGRFTMPWVDPAAEKNGREPLSEGDYKLVFISPDGFNMMTRSEFEALGNQPVCLKRWGRLTGTMKIGTRPAANQAFCIDPYLWNEPWQGGVPISITWQLEGETDDDGRFVFDRIPPGEGKISRTIRFAQSSKSCSSTSTDSTGYRVGPGQSVEVAVGGTGWPLIGQIAVPDDFNLTPDWKFAYIRATVMSDEETRIREAMTKSAKVTQAKLEALRKEMMPPELLERCKKKSPEAARKYGDWLATDAGKAFQKRSNGINPEWTRLIDELRKNIANRRSFAASIEKDGSFRVEGVPSGTIFLNVWFMRPLDDPLGPTETIPVLLNYRVTLPPLAEGKTVSEEPFDAGRIVLKKVKRQ